MNASQWELWLIAGMLAVTFGVRYLTLGVLGRWRMPEGLLQALRYVPVAVLTAIVVPAALMSRGQLEATLGNAHLWAGLAAAAVAWRYGKLLPTILAGMGVFVVWRWLL